MAPSSTAARSSSVSGIVASVRWGLTFAPQSCALDQRLHGAHTAGAVAGIGASPPRASPTLAPGGMPVTDGDPLTPRRGRRPEASGPGCNRTPPVRQSLHGDRPRHVRMDGA
ncbi:MAG: hypothetical protein ACREQ5_17815, partial [Candidatus Dormibacteria bacterium]